MAMSEPLRVLIVEDSETDATLVLRALRRGGYEPDAVRVEAEETMREAIAARAFDIILSDHDMPEFSSTESLALRDELCPDVPFIIVSGRISEELIVGALKAGAQDYVLKRDLTRLASAVSRALREAQAHAETKRAEAALRDSEERYALAVRGSNDGIWDWNVVTEHVYYSPRYVELLGFEEGELPSNAEVFVSRVHPDHVPVLRGALEAHLLRREPFRVELRVLTKQGEYRWFVTRGQALWDDDGKPIRMAGAISDLTDQKRAEESLREKIAIIERQQEAIRVLGAPVIEVWDGVLMTPVLGALDEERAALMMEAVLAGVIRARSRYVILDLTGVDAIDAATANHVVKLVSAVELLGGRGIIVGIQPKVARAIVDAGMDLSRWKTLGNLRQALVFCMRERARTAGRAPRAG